MAQHDCLKIDAGILVYFCDPQSPWAARHQQEHQWTAASALYERHRSEHAQRRGVAAVAAALNGRSRKTLD